MVFISYNRQGYLDLMTGNVSLHYYVDHNSWLQWKCFLVEARCIPAWKKAPTIRRLQLQTHCHGELAAGAGCRQKTLHRKTHSAVEESAW